MAVHRSSGKGQEIQLLGLVLAWVAACSPDAVRSATWVVEREERGDTLIVRTISGSVWGEPMVLLEEIRIGALEGPDEVTLGSVQALAVDSDGGIFVFDRGAPALRYYDSTGRYVRTLGGKGSGPGEYRDAILGMAVRRDGRLIVRDPHNARLTLYNPDGTVSDHWLLASTLFTPQALTIDTSDHVYLTVRVGDIEPDKPWPIGLLHLDAAGRAVDTILPPAVAGEPTSRGGPFLPSKVWSFGPHRAFAVGVTERYGFEIRRPGRRPVRVERVWQPLHLDPPERAEWEAVREWAVARSPARQPSPIPDTKPAYLGLSFGTDGRIWVRRHVTAVQDTTRVAEQRPGQRPPITWREPPVWDVFEEDGTYMGEVRAPLRTSLMVIGRDRVWGVRLGEHGEPYVLRFRLVPTDGGRL